MNLTDIMNSIKTQGEIIANGGTDIGNDGNFPQIYNQIFDQQQAGLISKSEAQARIGTIVGHFESPSGAENSGKTYDESYRSSYTKPD